MSFLQQASIALTIGLLAGAVPIMATRGDRPPVPLRIEARQASSLDPLGLRRIGPVLYQARATLDMTGSSALDLNMENYRFGPLEAFDFAPSFIQGTPDQKLTLVLRNASPVAHNFTLQTQSITHDVPPNTLTLVEVTIPSSGGALFYCRFHSDKGMNGQLLAGRIEAQPLSMPTPVQPR